MQLIKMALPSTFTFMSIKYQVSTFKYRLSIMNYKVHNGDTEGTDVHKGGIHLQCHQTNGHTHKVAQQTDKHNC